MSSRNRFILSLFLLVAVFLVGSLGYWIIEDDWTFHDAAYMCAITLSTVGYGEVRHLDQAGRYWTIGVITVGIGLVSIAFMSLVAVVVEGEFRTVLGRRIMERQINQLRNHVILCGYGRMGKLVAEDFKAQGIPVVLVERDLDALERAQTHGHLYVRGDATEEATLEQAGIARARALIATLSMDSDNIFVTLTARGMRSDLKIIARAEQPATQVKLERAGADRVVCPQVIGAVKITNSLTRPTVVDFVEAASKGLELEMDEYVVAADSGIVGKSLKDAQLRQRTGAMVVAIKRAGGQTIFGPGADEKIQPNDSLILIGPEGVSIRLAEL